MSNIVRGIRFMVLYGRGYPENEPMSFESLLNRPFRWPTAADKLFQVSPRWDGNAVLADHPHSRMVLMLTGYKRAADSLVKQAAEDTADRDTLVFPIIFNYRQFLELSLKYLISTYGRSVGVDAIWNSHDLSKLWSQFEAVLEGFGLEDEDGATAAVGARSSPSSRPSTQVRSPSDTPSIGRDGRSSWPTPIWISRFWRT